jgi:hypothetical protein
MFIKLVRTAEVITGTLLGSVAICVITGNVLVCLALVFWGPAPIESNLLSL